MKPFRFKTIKLFGPPGTGKTTTLLNRIEKYIERGVAPHKIAYFSFTKKAINEGIERAKSKFPNLQEQDLFNFRTIHSFCRQQFSTIPVLDEDIDIKEFWSCVDEWYKDNNVVTEFIRFNLFGNQEHYSGKIVMTLLNVKGKIIEKDNQWLLLKSNVRKNINKAIK